MRFAISRLLGGTLRSTVIKNLINKQFSVSSISRCHVEPIKPVRIIFISDTHSSHEQLGTLPDGDILIHAGDFTNSRPPKPAEYKEFIDWYAGQPHKHKVLISGNRDQFMDTCNSTKVELL